MSTKSTKKTMIRALDGQPSETTGLVSAHHHKPKVLPFFLVFFFMLNRSVNLVMYKALTTFSYFFSQYFEMNYTLFAIVAVMNFPGNLLNMACVPFYSKYRIKHVIICFELLLCVSCLAIIPFHFFAGLLLCRLVTGFCVTGVRTEVNATIGAYTTDARRTRAISIIEMSFALSSAGFLVVGSILHWFGWKTFFFVAGGTILIITLLIACLVPSWYLRFETLEERKQKDKRKSAYSTAMLIECLKHKRLTGVFCSILLNKIARNAFYYTFSKWLAQDYGLNVQQAGFVTMTMAAGHFLGTLISPVLVDGLGIKGLGLGIYGSCFAGALLQVGAMIVEPTYTYLGYKTPLYGACTVVFVYFCGCQLWYNNLLEICFAVTPRRNLFPAVQTILLACGSLGGSIGTIGSTFWYTWGNESAIALICAFCNLIIVFITIILFIHYKRHRKLLQKQEKGEKLDITITNQIDINHDNKVKITTESQQFGEISSILAQSQSKSDKSSEEFLAIGSDSMFDQYNRVKSKDINTKLSKNNFKKLDIEFGSSIEIDSAKYNNYSSYNNYYSVNNNVNGNSIAVQTSPMVHNLMNNPNLVYQNYHYNSNNTNTNTTNNSAKISYAGAPTTDEETIGLTNVTQSDDDENDVNTNVNINTSICSNGSINIAGGKLKKITNKTKNKKNKNENEIDTESDISENEVLLHDEKRDRNSFD